ncbi:unnamed protein product [Acanthoscelides obtectus]|uniref:Cuticle protein n=1 Tax=Acanthoscelides obtectus TaxID=200917 RepID=A0A9P0QAH2_ACAOB|nr:unnamed protein product [Acanthoscelides obtectus]CAK1658915.1 hypothetical protein AOBTE_LOCUS21200 [Acanthoscelides obtectus]
MNTLSFITFLAAVACACASSHILQGPSSRSTVIGPDGSLISSYTPGAQVIADHAPAATLLAAAPLAYSAHPLAYSAHHLAYAAHHLPYAAPLAYAAAAPVYGRSSHTVVAGPSGTISHADADNRYIF